MRGDISGVRNGQSWPRRGSIIEIDDAEGASLCSMGMAEPVAEEERTETATAPAAETRSPGGATASNAVEEPKKAASRPTGKASS